MTSSVTTPAEGVAGASAVEILAESWSGDYVMPETAAVEYRRTGITGYHSADYLATVTMRVTIAAPNVRAASATSARVSESSRAVPTSSRVVAS